MQVYSGAWTAFMTIGLERIEVLNYDDADLYQIEKFKEVRQNIPDLNCLIYVY